ncbi:hypothetical protein AB0A74_00465 [Saccharothrix sp. NPDC042600]|uniref:hypothetical protein n=1 Tax=Saccharothrix TaxID=2071 RepID=UPI0033FCB755
MLSPTRTCSSSEIGLDLALLTDAELAGGPAAWRHLDDPLPLWDDVEPHDHNHALPRR